MTVTNAELNDLIRFVDDIGMYATDRPINDTENHEGSCIHRTDFCDQTCYNMKLYKMYKNMANRDDRCETVWQKLSTFSAIEVKQWIAKRRKPTQRIRHMTRGEAFKDVADIFRVRAMCLDNPDVLWWVPTRAWRDDNLRYLIEKALMTLPNCAINASFDPSNTDDEWRMMQDAGWNIMFFGDDDRTTAPNGDRMFKCPKTHKGLKGHCMDCKAGCFAQKTINRTTVVHLSEH